MSNPIYYVAKQPLGSLNQLVCAIADNYVQLHCPNIIASMRVDIANLFHTKLPTIFYLLTLGSTEYPLALQQLIETVDVLDKVYLHGIRNIYYDDVLPATYLIPCLKVVAETYSTQHELYKTIVDNITMPTKAQILLES